MKLPGDSIFNSQQVSRLDDSPVMTASEGYFRTGAVPYTQGVEPQPRALLPGYDSAIACLLIGAFLLLAFSLRNYSTMLKSLPRDLFSVRRRDNLFEEHTINETRLLFSLIAILCICESILASAYVVSVGVAPHLSQFMTLIVFIGVAGGYYLFQLAAYSSVGAIFADKTTSRLWIKGFNATQAILGLALVIPALAAVFDPGVAGVMVSIAIVLYIIARIIFISKGFRLFYQKFGSIVYFILYLCTLEVVPLILIVRYYAIIAN